MIMYVNVIYPSEERKNVSTQKRGRNQLGIPVSFAITHTTDKFIFLH